MRFVYMRSRNAAASGPAMSILPSVDASITPTPVRTATHSRSTAVFHRPPVRGSTTAASTGRRSRTPRRGRRARGGSSVTCRDRTAPAVGSGGRGERHRRGWRPGVRRTLRPGAGAEGLVHDRGGQHARRAALVERGADVRRPLDVLDRAEVVLHRVQHVRDRLVALEVDEVAREIVPGYEPEGPHGRWPAAAPVTVSHGGPSPSGTKHAVVSS